MPRLQVEAREAKRRGGETDPRRSEGEAILFGIHHGAITEHTLYRGLALNRAVYERYAALRPGQTFEWEEPQSFSFHQRLAEKYAFDKNDPGKRRIVIAVEGGTQGIPVRLHVDTRTARRDHEMITNGRFIVTRVETETRKHGPIRFIFVKQEGVL
ncbi:MAG TPA: hypothetical protein VKW70_00765 [Terriglobia bacterium]|nr:hypothetical protein [Terriglobia bacterium]